VELERVVLKATASSPEDRYQTAEDMVEDLESALKVRKKSALEAHKEPLLEVCESSVRFFEVAGFEVEQETHDLFWVRSNIPEWRDAGQMPVYCFEKGQPVTGSEIKEVVEGRGSSYAFITFHERLVDGAVQQLWKFRQEDNLIVIPIHIAEIKQILSKPRTTPSPAHWRLGSLKRRWSKLTDPYASLSSVTEPQWFFGKQRQTMIQEILSEMTAGVDLFAVFGMRRIGKTTLLNQLVLACREQRYPVVKILCKHLSYQYTYADMLSEVIQEWSTALEALYPDLQMLSPSPTVERYTPNTASRFKSDVHKLAENIRRHTGEPIKLVLILDEVDHIFPNQKSPEETYYQYCNLTQILKSLIEAPVEASGWPTIVSIVVAIEYPWIHMTDRFPYNERFQNPLYGRFQLKPVELLQREDWDDMVQTLGALAGLEYTIEGLDVLYHNSAGHPQITRRMGSCLVELRDSKEIGSTITAKEVHLALDHFLKHPHSYTYYLETTLWKDPLSTDLDREQILMQELARKQELAEDDLLSELLGRYKEFIKVRDGNPASDEQASGEKSKLADALRHLVDLQIVAEDREKGKYAIRIPIYRNWIRQNVLGMGVEHA
jgi:hypothetical protein